ncbi:hypothetical protein KIM372_05980 [Bombiscardovia nodaiensis]|uniref:Uncharacterized protein n=1 Tax=Bombiscardovia nodaiensis TaxID=2932181 RepID=A0ABN6S940_9BIFI|nr:hypothetical protein KIM372_05980 [Bombiscardovia nodaiensis]
MPRVGDNRPQPVRRISPDGQTRVFESLSAAAKYMRESGEAPKATSAALGVTISKRRSHQSYGYTWAYAGSPTPIPTHIIHMVEVTGQSVHVFTNTVNAAHYLQDSGIAPNARADNIEKAASKVGKIAYGYRWVWGESYELLPLEKLGPIAQFTYDGEKVAVYRSAVEAARALRQSDETPMAKPRHIMQAIARGENPKATRAKFQSLGYVWHWADPNEPDAQATMQGGPQVRGNYQSLQVECINSKDEVIAVYANTKAAAQAIHSERPEVKVKTADSSICLACQRRHLYIYGYRWRFAQDAHLPTVEDRRHISINEEAVDRIAPDGTLETFASATEAARHLFKTGEAPKASPSFITNVIHGRGRTAYGYVWTMHGQPPADPLPLTRYPSAHPKTRHTGPVERILPDGQVIRYESIIEAVREMMRSGEFPKASSPRISAVCLGKFKRAYGSQWRYVGSDTGKGNTYRESSE